MSRFLLHLLCFLVLAPAFAAGADTVTIESETAEPGLLSDLAQELGSHATPETVFEARRQARRGAEQLEAYLNSRGYFAPEIDYRVEPGPPIVAFVKVEPGPQFEIQSISIDVGETDLPQDTRDVLSSAMALHPGDPALPARILSQEAGLISALRASGYAEARAGNRTVAGDREAATLDVTYSLAPGPRIILGDVIFPPETPIRTDYLDRLIPFEPESLYTPERLAELTRRLNATRMFQLATVQLSSEPAGITADGDEIRDVLVTLERLPRYTLTSGASYSTSEGPGLTASLTRKNVSQRGDTVTVSATVGSLERAFAGEWRIPNILAYDRTLVTGIRLAQDETDAFDREAITLSSALETRVNRTLSYSLGAESEFTRELDAFEQRDQQVLSVNGAARLDHSDDPLDPTEGWRADARLEPGIVIGDREAQFASINAQISAYRGLDRDDQFVFAGRIRNGYVFGATLRDLPVSRRFYAGGGGSARGFEYQSVGPTDVDGQPTGGRGLLEMSAELRWRRDKPLGFVVFLDGAGVSAEQSVDFDELRYSAGIGVRYDTPIGPIRFDVATPIDPDEGDDPIQLYISIGQAF